MLTTVDTTSKTRKADYRALSAELGYRLGELQREALALNIPIVILFEGWGASGKGSQINRLLLSLDPRSVKVHSIESPTEEERMKPYLWRFWTKTPPRGRIGILGRSWYGRFLVEGIDEAITSLDEVPNRY